MCACLSCVVLCSLCGFNMGWQQVRCWLQLVDQTDLLSPRRESLMAAEVRPGRLAATSSQAAEAGKGGGGGAAARRPGLGTSARLGGGAGALGASLLLLLGPGSLHLLPHKGGCSHHVAQGRQYLLPAAVQGSTRWSSFVSVVQLLLLQAGKLAGSESGGRLASSGRQAGSESRGRQTEAGKQRWAEAGRHEC